MSNDARQLADALGGVVRVRIRGEELRGLDARQVERVCNGMLERAGVRFPSISPRRSSPPARERPLNGRITYYGFVDGNEIEVVWRPDGK